MGADLILFKTDRQQAEFKHLDIRLQIIFYAVSAVAESQMNYETMVTDCIRTKEEDDKFGGIGIHVVKRAVDFNFCKKDGSRIFDPDSTETLCNFINNFIPYGYGKFKTVIFHEVGAGEHFHLQVSRKIKTTIFNTLKKERTQ